MENDQSASSKASLIDAATQFVWIVGDPIAQVKAPQAMNPHYLAAGENLLVLPAPVSSEDLRTVFEGARRIRNLRGWIATVPHKIALVDWMDELSVAARVAGAVNAVRFRDGKAFGDLFDGYGFVSGLARRGFATKGCSALVIGAGGVGSAIALALAQEGAARVSVVDVNGWRAQQLALRLAEHGPAGTRFDAGSATSAADFQLIVNATPIGMAGDTRSPIDTDLLRGFHVVAEVVMTPELTPLLHAARKLGCEIHPGKQVLDGQLQRLLDFFR
ncbi:shikimate dehydrogenase [Variovorax sp. W1I1]|uniref:shikimate dehydrogenase family protein n=1 Tax=Variovorax sp. W1I1 TaxID=3042309 RepID=UPI0027888512|nr:shikimate dehydrogenase [Variovorax sp. W1I1]MDQ0610910.1 shikimate dehydrogenase [Variovorax sp. W1I1]